MLKYHIIFEMYISFKCFVEGRKIVGIRSPIYSHRRVEAWRRSLPSLKFFSWIGWSQMRWPYLIICHVAQRYYAAKRIRNETERALRVFVILDGGCWPIRKNGRSPHRLDSTRVIRRGSARFGLDGRDDSLIGCVSRCGRGCFFDRRHSLGSGWTEDDTPIARTGKSVMAAEWSTNSSIVVMCFFHGDAN